MCIKITKINNKSKGYAEEDYYVNIVYRNPGRDKLTFINELNSLLEKTGRNINTSYIGDFNIDIKEKTNWWII